ncbi:MAG: YHS domain-containing protein [Phycisphaerales bacterium]|nr:YHS domain-containing protein [Phycisphaerales bacterium]
MDFANKVAELTRDDSAKEANIEDGVALAGYDAVQYIDGNKAVKGETSFTSAYKGVSYRFASKGTLEKFAADPEKYVPAYGGWCGTAMADGKKVEVDPKHFKVVGGKTVLFYNGFWGDALKDWNKDEKGLKPKADEKWNELTRAKKKGA